MITGLLPEAPSVAMNTESYSRDQAFNRVKTASSPLMKKTSMKGNKWIQGAKSRVS